MINIETVVFNANLRNVSPFEKIIYVLSVLFVCMICKSIIVWIIVFLVNSILIVKKNNIFLKDYIRYLKIPLVFIFISVFTIMVNIEKYNHKEFLFRFNVFNFYLGVTKSSLIYSSKILLKSFSMISALYFLILTTFLTDFINVLKIIKVPKLVIELMMLMYRFIFIMLNIFNMVYVSQKARCGYMSLKNSYSSFGKLLAAVLIKSYRMSETYYNALESRCYNGEFNYIKKKYELNKLNYLYNFLFIMLLMGIGILEKLYCI